MDLLLFAAGAWRVPCIGTLHERIKHMAQDQQSLEVAGRQVLGKALQLLGTELQGVVTHDLERDHGSEWRAEGARILGMPLEQVTWSDPAVVLRLVRHDWARLRATLAPVSSEEIAFLLTSANMVSHGQTLGKRQAAKAVGLVLKVLRQVKSPAVEAAERELVMPRPPVRARAAAPGPQAATSAARITLPSWWRYAAIAFAVAVLGLAAFLLDAQGQRPAGTPAEHGAASASLTASASVPLTPPATR